MIEVGDIDKKIALAIDVCGKRYTDFIENPFSRIYPFATENIAGYLSLFPLENRSLFTVGSSGDQAINAILNGCKLIYSYDICPFASEYFNLKKVAILMLNRNEFIKFFHYTKGLGNLIGANRMVFDVDVYSKLREGLDLETSYFWDELFKRFPPLVVRNKLFRHEEYSTRVIKEINPYLTSDINYQVLKSKINEATVVFSCDDIFNIDKGITFDNIFLSNIADYYPRAKVRDLFDKLYDNLTDGGKMLIAYLYDTDIADQMYFSSEDIYNLFGTLEIFPKGTTITSFLGVSGVRTHATHIKDSVLCYRKVKKTDK